MQMTSPSSTPPPGVPFKLPVKYDPCFLEIVDGIEGYVCAIRNEEKAAYLVHAINAHAKFESENAELRRALEVCRDALSHADDDIREHLQVARFNLTGKTHTGEQLEIPNPPLLIHAHGIAQSMIVRAECKEALRQAYTALTPKEAK